MGMAMPMGVTFTQVLAGQVPLAVQGSAGGGSTLASGLEPVVPPEPPEEGPAPPVGVPVLPPEGPAPPVGVPVPPPEGPAPPAGVPVLPPVGPAPPVSPPWGGRDTLASAPAPASTIPRLHAPRA